MDSKYRRLRCYLIVVLISLIFAAIGGPKWVWKNAYPLALPLYAAPMEPFPRKHMNFGFTTANTSCALHGWAVRPHPEAFRIFDVFLFGNGEVDLLEVLHHDRARN